jgi:hypothetical protein
VKIQTVVYQKSSSKIVAVANDAENVSYIQLDVSGNFMKMDCRLNDDVRTEATRLGKR